MSFKGVLRQLWTLASLMVTVAIIFSFQTNWVYLKHKNQLKQMKTRDNKQKSAKTTQKPEENKQKQQNK